MKTFLASLALLGILLAACDNSTGSKETPSRIDTASPPIFSPPGGTFALPQSVTITSSTNGASLHYTLDGSIPTASSLLYTGPVQVNSDATLKAIAIKEGMAASRVDSTVYVIAAGGAAALPGSWRGSTGMGYTTTMILGRDSSITVIEMPNSVSFVKPAYRTRGNWLATDSTLWTSATAADSSVDGTTWSTRTVGGLSQGTLDYLISGDTLRLNPTGNAIVFVRVAARIDTVASPTFQPGPRRFAGPQTIAISCSTSGADIHYSLDGSLPTSASSLYTVPLALSQSTTVKVAAFKSGFASSPVASATFTILPSVVGTWKSLSDSLTTYVLDANGAATLFSIFGLGTHVRETGTWAFYDTTVDLSFTAVDSSGDGVIWTLVSTGNAGSRLFFSATGDTLNDGGTEAYIRISHGTAFSTVAAPSTSLPGGAYRNNQFVSLSCATVGSSLFYTLDGSEPISSSTPYTGPISVVANTTLRVVATKTGMSNSTTIQLDYQILVGGSVVDTTFVDVRDGHVYSAVKIGTQTWMAQNLDFALDSSWCYEGQDSLCSENGRLYSLNAALDGAPISNSTPSHVQGACPSGWHFPSYAEWTTLLSYAGGMDAAGIPLQAKSAGGTDRYGFSILPAGERYYYPGDTTRFSGIGDQADFWTASGRDIEFRTRSGFVDFFDNTPIRGMSVRCVEN